MVSICHNNENLLLLMSLRMQFTCQQLAARTCRLECSVCICVCVRICTYVGMHACMFTLYILNLFLHFKVVVFQFRHST